jgi:hypothetical protein
MDRPASASASASTRCFTFRSHPRTMMRFSTPGPPCRPQAGAFQQPASGHPATGTADRIIVDLARRLAEGGVIHRLSAVRLSKHVIEAAAVPMVGELAVDGQIPPVRGAQWSSGSIPIGEGRAPGWWSRGPGRAAHNKDRAALDAYPPGG